MARPRKTTPRATPPDRTSPSGVERLVQGSESPTWPSVVGYELASTHVAVFAHALAHETLGAPFAAELWRRATGEVFAPQSVSCVREGRVSESRHPATGWASLLVSLHTWQNNVNLGLEPFFDVALDVRRQRELLEVHRTSHGCRFELVLLALGAAQVCEVPLAPGVRCWTVADVLTLAPWLRNAGAAYIVEPWLEELELEELRRRFADQIHGDDTTRAGYRWLSQRIYRYALLAKELDLEAGGPWDLTMHEGDEPVLRSRVLVRRFERGREEALAQVELMGMAVRLQVQWGSAGHELRADVTAWRDRLDAAAKRRGLEARAAKCLTPCLCVYVAIND